MADSKNLKFQFVLDDQSFQRVKRALGELTSDAQKLAKALQGGGGLFGGANVGKTPSIAQTNSRQAAGFSTQGVKTNVGQAILGDVEAFRKLAQSGKAGMTAMTDAVRSGVRQQMDEIAKLENKLASLQKRFEKDPRAAYDGAFRDRLTSQMVARQGQITNAQAGLANLQSVGAQLGLPGMGGAAAAAGGGGGGASGMIAALGGPMAIIKVGGLVAAGAVTALNTSMAATNMMADQTAARGDIARTFLSKTKNADVSDQLKLRYIAQMDNQSKAEMLARVNGPDATKIDTLNQLKNLAVGAATLGAAGDVTGGGFTKVAYDTRELERQREMLNVAGRQTAYLETFERGNEYADSSRGERAFTARAMGRGFYKKKLPFQNLNVLDDNFTNWDTALKERGFSGVEQAQAKLQGQGMAGEKFGYAQADAIMRANASGYGGYANFAASAAKQGSPDIYKLALNTKADQTAAIMMGQGILGSGFDPRGSTSGVGLMGSIFGGPGFQWSGGATDFNLAQQAMAGIGLGSSITSGGMDTYQAGRNLVNAINLNPNGTTYANDYLGTGMNLKQMMDGARGDMTETAKAYGLTPQMMRSQLSGSMSSVLERYVDQGGSDPMSMAMKNYRASGTSIDEHLKKLYSSGKGSEAKALGVMFGQLSGEGEEAGIGLSKILAGVDSSATEGKLKTGGVDDEFKANAKALTDQVKITADALKVIFDDVIKAKENNKDFGKIWDNVGRLATEAKNVADEFERLAKVTPETRKRIEGTGVVNRVVDVVTPSPEGVTAEPKGSRGIGGSKKGAL